MTDQPIALALTVETLREHGYVTEADKVQVLLDHRAQHLGDLYDIGSEGWLTPAAIGKARTWEIVNELAGSRPIVVDTALCCHSNLGSGSYYWSLTGAHGLYLGLLHQETLPRTAGVIELVHYRPDMTVRVYFDPATVEQLGKPYVSTKQWL